jgi:hypothetical protein
MQKLGMLILFLILPSTAAASEWSMFGGNALHTNVYDTSPPMLLYLEKPPEHVILTQSVRITSLWQDSFVNLAYAELHENTTGEWEISRKQLSGMKDWANFTLTPKRLGIFAWKIRAFDILGNARETTLHFFKVSLPEAEEKLEKDIEVTLLTKELWSEIGVGELKLKNVGNAVLHELEVKVTLPQLPKVKVNVTPERIDYLIPDREKIFTLYVDKLPRGELKLLITIFAKNFEREFEFLLEVKSFLAALEEIQHEIRIKAELGWNTTKAELLLREAFSLYREEEWFASLELAKEALASLTPMLPVPEFVLPEPIEREEKPEEELPKEIPQYSSIHALILSLLVIFCTSIIAMKFLRRKKFKKKK